MPEIGVNSLAEILPRREKRSLGTLQVYPERVSFNSQDPGESIYILTRSHIATNIGWIMRFIGLLLFPFIVIVVISVFNQLLPADLEHISITNYLPLSDLIMGLLLYFSLCVSYALAKFLDWYFDIYLVTNLRILHVDFQVFTGKSVAEAALVNIEDVSQNVIGFFPSFFNYGEVLVQTAAEKTKFNLKALPDPSWFRDVITDLSNLAKTRRHAAETVGGTFSTNQEVADILEEGGEP